MSSDVGKHIRDKANKQAYVIILIRAYTHGGRVGNTDSESARHFGLRFSCAPDGVGTRGRDCGVRRSLPIESLRHQLSIAKESNILSDPDTNILSDLDTVFHCKGITYLGTDLDCKECFGFLFLRMTLTRVFIAKGEKIGHCP